MQAYGEVQINKVKLQLASMSEGCSFLLDMCAGAIGLCNFFEIIPMHFLYRNPAFKFGNVRFKGRRLTDGRFVLFW